MAEPRPGLTEPNAQTGERWEAAQVWGHINEFIPYWIESIEETIDNFAGQPIAFGRTSSDPQRLVGIEEGRQLPMDLHVHWLEQHLSDLREFLSAIPEAAWSGKIGRHPTIGEMELKDMLERFLVGHLEEHTDQLEGLE